MSTNPTLTKLLIITNNATSSESLEYALKQHQFQIRSTSSCGEGEQLSKVFKPDVILVDLWLPKAGGVEFCNEIRAYTNAPILILTTNNKPGIIEQMLDAGADECLLKPAPTNILVAHLNTLARRYQVELEARKVLKTMRYEDINNSILYE